MSQSFHLCTHRRLPFLVIYMETALQCYKRRATSLPAQENREMLELLIKRFGSKIQRSLQSSLPWNQTRSNSLTVATSTNSRLIMKGSKTSERAVTIVSARKNGKAQPLVTPFTHLWEVVPIYDLTPPSPYQKRLAVKPSVLPQIRGTGGQVSTDWNKIRLSNESNMSLASQMSSMSTMSILNHRGSTRNYMSWNLLGGRSRHSA